MEKWLFRNMKKQSNKIKREDLHFAQSVKKSFAFLSRTYNMQSVESTPINVRYENKDVYINIYHENLSYELGVRIGQLSDKKGRSYWLEEVLRVFAGQKHNYGTFFQASNAEDVRKSVIDVAMYVEKFYGPLLRNDSDAFQRLESACRLFGEQYERESILKDIRLKAEKAWKNKEYEKVVKLFKPYHSELKKTEIAKLEYSLKHINYLDKK